MLIVAIILAGLALNWLGALLYMSTRGKSRSRTISSCPDCGGTASVRADPPQSRLELRCHNETCTGAFHPVRASALSVFGVTLVGLTTLSGVLGYKLTQTFGFQTGGQIVATLLATLLGGVLFRLVLRSVAAGLLRSELSPAWQEEVTSFLAPPPFLK